MRHDELGTSVSIKDVLRTRFEQNPNRHGDVSWEEVEVAFGKRPDLLDSIAAMEETGGEPDVVGRDATTGSILVCDCSREAPVGRRSLCYDDEALRKRKRNPPKGSALAQAAQMGVSLLCEDEYRLLQTRGEYDLKTSCWIAVPPDIRRLGGALFCERRYGRSSFSTTEPNPIMLHEGGAAFCACPSRLWKVRKGISCLVLLCEVRWSSHFAAR